MEQRIKKIKLFRALKIAFYCLGLPLFVLAVMALASQIYGHWPFSGNTGAGVNFFSAFKSFFTGTALYSVWIAFAVWLIITIVQIVCGKLIKNRRARMLVVVAVMLVVMLVPVFAIDAIYDAKVSALQAEAAKGVVIEDYSYQLSYYHTHTGENITPNGKRVSLTDTLIKNVTNFCTFYNIPFYGDAKLYSVNNLSCEPLYYDEFGFDYNEDDAVDAYDHVRIMNTFDVKSNKLDKDLQMYKFDKLTLKSKNGAKTQEVNGNFACKVWTQAIPAAYNSSETKDVNLFVWYDADKTAQVKSDGLYGEAFYSKNGLLSDGYIFSAEVALNILEDYYEGQEEMTAAYKEYKKAAGSSAKSEESIQAEIIIGANDRLKDRYTGADSTEEDKLLWARENNMAEGFSLTSGELTTVLSVLGEQIGESEGISSVLGAITTLIDGPLVFGIEDILEKVGLSEELSTWACDKLGFTGMKLGILIDDGTTRPEHPTKHLAIEVSGGPFGTSVYLDLDETFGLDQVTGILAPLGIDNAMLADVLTLLGLAVSDSSSLDAMIGSVLATLYWYQSPVLDTVYDYYADENIKDSEEGTKEAALYKYQLAYAKYMRANYEGSMHGYMIGSQLTGSKIGDGTYDASLGLADLTAVKQLQTDLSYKPMMYSILIVRDMLMTFAAIAIFFTALSYICADREVLYATGKIEPKDKKKSKKGKDETKEDEDLPVEDNSDKEVQ